MDSRFRETVVVESTVLGNGEMILTVRRQSLVGIASIMVVVSTLPLCFGTIIAANEATLAVKSGLFVISPVFCMVTGGLTLSALTRKDSTLMDKAEIVGVMSALVSCVAAVLYICDLINNMGNWDVDEKVTIFSGLCFILSLMEMALSGMVSRGCCTTNQNSENAFTIARLFGAPTVTTQTPPTHQTPPTAQLPSSTDMWSTPSASWSTPFPPVAPPPPYEKPPNYNSIIT